MQASIHDPADSVLLDTLSHSIPHTEELGLGPAEEEGVFTTVLAGFVDALKSRLVVEIDELAIHVQHPLSGAFELRLARIAFLPREDKLSEKVLSICGIEAFLRRDKGDKEDLRSESPVTTVTPSSHAYQRRPSEDHGLSESMMFSAHEAESLYMSAYSQPADLSTYFSTESYHIQSEPKSSSPEDLSFATDKGFRFFYFEEDLVFHVTTSQTDSEDPLVPTTSKPRPAPVLQSAIPTAHLFLNPEVNLFPSISLISTILSLSPTSQKQTQTSNDTSGIDFSWPGGVVVHFGSESEETIARLADWKVIKRLGEESLSISIGCVEILTSTGQQILSLAKSGKLNVSLHPSSLQVSLPEVNLLIDVGGVESLQPLIKAMKQVWQESLSMDTQQVSSEDSDEDWNENLIVEKTPISPSQGRTFTLSIQKFSVNLQTLDGTIKLSVTEVNACLQASSNQSLEFSGATVSIPSVPDALVTIKKTSSGLPTVEFIATDRRPRPGFLENGAQEILDDFLVGEPSRSDDAWGMIRSDSGHNSEMLIKIKLPRIDVRVTSAKDIEAVKRAFSRIQKTALMFLDDGGKAISVESKDKIKFLVEFALEEGTVGVKLDEGERFEGQWEGVEGTIVNGVAGGELVGVVDMTKLRVDVVSPLSPRKVLHESIHKVHIIWIRSDDRITIPHRQWGYDLFILRTDKLSVGSRYSISTSNIMYSTRGLRSLGRFSPQHLERIQLPKFLLPSQSLQPCQTRLCLQLN